MKYYFVGFLLLGSLSLFGMSFQSRQNGGEKEEIRSRTMAYQDAYNQHNPKSLSSFWAEDAIYINPKTGAVINGRNAIEEEFNKMFVELKNVRMETTIESIEFPSDQTAVEKGIAKLTISNQPPSVSHFKATFEKRNGQWMMTNVSEAELISASTEDEHLKELAWLVGNWKEEDENVKLETNTEWDINKKFLIMHFALYLHDKPEIEGKQIVGWDPVENQIVSWVFDSDGGYGEGKWRKKGNQWMIENAYTFANGSRGSSIDVYMLNAENTITWESMGREVDGEFLPNIGPINVMRKKVRGLK